VVSALSLYLRLSWHSIRAQMAYRASFVALAFGNFLVTLASFIATWLLFRRFHGIGGWSLAEVAVLYGVVNISMGLPDMSSSGFEQCGALARRGDFDRILLRPRGAALQLLGREFSLRRAGRVVQGLLVLTWGLAHVNAPLDARAIGLLFLAICGGICVFLGLGLLHAACSFWTLQGLELMVILTFGGAETSEFPVHIYDRWLQRVFLVFVPIATVSYFPVLSVLRKPDVFQLPQAAHALAPLAGLAFLLVAVFIWRLAIRRYASTGS
jgi:ABC-2 type transport system permease protein